MITISKINCTYKKIVLMFFILLLIISGKVYATDSISAEVNLSSNYLKLQNLSEEEAENVLISSMYSVDMSETILENELNRLDFSKIVGSHVTLMCEYPVSASSLDTSYSLKDSYVINVKNQGQMECCWAIAVLNSMELNIQVTEGKIQDFSERHMDYATSENFYDGTNPNAFKRSVKTGGTTLIGLAYLTNGQGAVLEEDMPFENNNSDISLTEIDKTPNTYVTDYNMLPNIYKYYDSNGNAICYSSTGKIYTEEEVQILRNDIKEHIIKYGGVVAYTSATQYDYYSSSDIISSKAYYCNDINTNFDHAVTIVGWDDNYSRDNFTGKAKPTKDGAYLVLNSYSDKVFDEGYLYISYEDVWIESTLYGITGTSEINYDNIYQYDNYGAGLPITLYDNQNNVLDSVYYSSIYSRNDAETELLDAVSVASNKYCEFEIYVNPNGNDLNSNNLIKVATTDVLSPGYHKINFDSIKLTGTEFAIVIKEIAVDGNASLMVEPQINGTFYEYANATIGNSKISIDGDNWQNLADLGVLYSGGLSIDMTKSDVCIKAFTSKVKDNVEQPSTPEDNNEIIISSEKYEITSDKYITKIYDNTKLSDLLNDITISVNYKIYDKNNIEVNDLDVLAKTNMYLDINGDRYYLAVRADINGDGKISLIDLSKHLACYAELEGYELDGAYLKACDLNLDGKFSLIDLSQFIVLYNNL